MLNNKQPPLACLISAADPSDTAMWAIIENITLGLFLSICFAALLEISLPGVLLPAFLMGSGLTLVLSSLRSIGAHLSPCFQIASTVFVALRTGKLGELKTLDSFLNPMRSCTFTVPLNKQNAIDKCLVSIASTDELADLQLVSLDLFGGEIKLKNRISDINILVKEEDDDSKSSILINMAHRFHWDFATGLLIAETLKKSILHAEFDFATSKLPKISMQKSSKRLVLSCFLLLLIGAAALLGSSPTVKEWRADSLSRQAQESRAAANYSDAEKKLKEALSLAEPDGYRGSYIRMSLANLQNEQCRTRDAMSTLMAPTLKYPGLRTIELLQSVLLRQPNSSAAPKIVENLERMAERDPAENYRTYCTANAFLLAEEHPDEAWNWLQKGRYEYAHTVFGLRLLNYLRARAETLHCYSKEMKVEMSMAFENINMDKK